MYFDFSTTTSHDQILKYMRFGRENKEKSEKREVRREMEKTRKEKLRERKNGKGDYIFFFKSITIFPLQVFL